MTIKRNAKSQNKIKVNTCHQTVNILLFAKDVVILVSELSGSVFSMPLSIQVHSAFLPTISFISDTIPSYIRPL